MRINDFSNILKDPRGISHEQIREINAILEEYPYFHAARALQLKILYAQKDYKYNKALKVAAAHITNRAVLFDFINSHANADGFLQSEEEKLEYPRLNTTESKYQMPAWFYNISVIAEEISAEEIEEDEIQESEDQLETENSESLPQGWLQIKRYNSSETSEDKKNKFEIIDRFLETNPKIEPTKNYTPNKSFKNSEPKKSTLMTETLAKIYLEQEKFQEAIQAYEILILKNPEKSGFFADQIRAIKNLQQNNS